MPGAERQTWYCSVGFERNTSTAPAGPRRGRARTAFPTSARRPSRAGARPGDEPLVVDAPRRRDDDVVRPVPAAMKGAERALGDVRDHLGRPKDWAAQRVAAEDGLRDEVEDELLRRVVHHGDLLEHDLSLGVEVVEAGSEDHVGHDVERRLQVLVEHARVDDRVVAGRGGVQLAAEGVEDLGDLEGRVGRRALEEQVLEEVVTPAWASSSSREPAPIQRPIAPSARLERLGDDARPAVEGRQQVVLHARIVGIRPG